MKKTILIFLVLLLFVMVSSAEAWRRYPSQHGRHQSHKYKQGYTHRSHGHTTDYKKNRRRAFHRHHIKKNRHRAYHYGRRYPGYHPGGHGFRHESSKKPYRESTASGYPAPPSAPNKSIPTPSPSPGKGKTISTSTDQQTPQQRTRERAAESEIWVPAKKEKVWVPGYWSYGIRKIWREDHWHYETDPDVKYWVAGHYQTRVVEPGSFQRR